MRTRPKNFVTQVPTETPHHALEYFSSKLMHETDCWDVHSTQDFEDRGFVLVDVRSRGAFDAGHVPGATHIPQAHLTEARLAEYAQGTLFVVYCAGPHCNGSTKAAIRLARLGRPVKEMIGGALGWVDEGFDLEPS
ncbi:MAG: rhodanese-like domain-containing protein [Planctomycetota bacterium]